MMRARQLCRPVHTGDRGEQPVDAVESHRFDVCLWCGNDDWEALRLCDGCGEVFYCSPGCRDGDLERHFPACKGERAGARVASLGEVGGQSRGCGGFRYMSIEVKGPWRWYEANRPPGNRRLTPWTDEWNRYYAYYLPFWDWEKGEWVPRDRPSIALADYAVFGLTHAPYGTPSLLMR